jgi:hypothetical protein
MRDYGEGPPWGVRGGGPSLRGRSAACGRTAPPQTTSTPTLLLPNRRRPAFYGERPERTDAASRVRPGQSDYDRATLARNISGNGTAGRRAGTAIPSLRCSWAMRRSCLVERRCASGKRTSGSSRTLMSPAHKGSSVRTARRASSPQGRPTRQRTALAGPSNARLQRLPVACASNRLPAFCG